MFDAGTLVAKIEADTKNFISGIEKSTKGAKDFSEKSSKNIQKVDTSIRNMAAAFVAWEGFSILGGKFQEFSKAAAVLEDRVARNGVVFKEQADSMEAWAASASKSMGLSKSEALEASYQFTQAGKALGLQGAELSEFAKKHAQMAADFASFNGGTTIEAVSKMGAAFRGEMDPIESFGISLTDANLKAEALALGLYSGKGELEDFAKKSAISSLIFKQGAEAIGDYTRNADGASNSLQTINAEMANNNATIGAMLLPAYVGLQNIFLTMSNSLMGIATWFQSLSASGVPLTEIMIGLGVAITTVVLPALWGMAVSATAAAVPMVVAFAPIAAIILGITAAVTGAILVYQNWGAITDWVVEKFNVLMTWFSGFFESVGAETSSFVSSFVEKFTNGINKISETISGWIESTITFFENLWVKLIELFTNSLNNILLKFQETFNFVQLAITTAFQFIKDIIFGAMGFIFSTISTALVNIWNNWQATWNNVVNFITTTKTNIVNTVKNISSSIGEVFSELIGKAGEWASNFMQMFIDGLMSKVNALKDTLAGIGNKIKSFLGFASPTDEGPASNSDEWAPNFMDMFIDGLKNKQGALTNQMNAIASQMEGVNGLGVSFGGVTNGNIIATQPVFNLYGNISSKEIAVEMLNEAFSTMKGNLSF